MQTLEECQKQRRGSCDTLQYLVLIAFCLLNSVDFKQSSKFDLIANNYNLCSMILKQCPLLSVL